MMSDEERQGLARWDNVLENQMLSAGEINGLKNCICIDTEHFQCMGL